VATQTTSTNQHSVLLVGDASGAVRGVDLILILRIRCKDRSRQSYAITKGGTGAGQNSFECEDLGLENWIIQRVENRILLDAASLRYSATTEPAPDTQHLH